MLRGQGQETDAQRRARFRIMERVRANRGREGRRQTAHKARRGALHGRMGKCTGTPTERRTGAERRQEWQSITSSAAWPMETDTTHHRIRPPTCC